MVTRLQPGEIPGAAYATLTSATPVYDMQRQTAATSAPAPRLLTPRRDLTVPTEVPTIDLVVPTE